MLHCSRLRIHRPILPHTAPLQGKTATPCHQRKNADQCLSGDTRNRRFGHLGVVREVFLRQEDVSPHGAALQHMRRHHHLHRTMPRQIRSLSDGQHTRTGAQYESRAAGQQSPGDIDRELSQENLAGRHRTTRCKRAAQGMAAPVTRREESGGGAHGCGGGGGGIFRRLDMASTDVPGNTGVGELSGAYRTCRTCIPQSPKISLGSFPP